MTRYKYTLYAARRACRAYNGIEKIRDSVRQSSILKQSAHITFYRDMASDMDQQEEHFPSEDTGKGSVPAKVMTMDLMSLVSTISTIVLPILLLRAIIRRCSSRAGQKRD